MAQPSAAVPTCCTHPLPPAAWGGLDWGQLVMLLFITGSDTHCPHRQRELLVSHGLPAVRASPCCTFPVAEHQEGEEDARGVRLTQDMLDRASRVPRAGTGRLASGKEPFVQGRDRAQPGLPSVRTAPPAQIPTRLLLCCPPAEPPAAEAGAQDTAGCRWLSPLSPRCH